MGVETLNRGRSRLEEMLSNMARGWSPSGRKYGGLVQIELFKMKLQVISILAIKIEHLDNLKKCMNKNYG